MTSAYYSRNQSFSRSYNAEVAEEEGRFPRLRAAKALGLSVAAFDAGCKAVGYVAHEWHHVGKYANEVDYFDTQELGGNPEFWGGAAAAYKSAKKRAEVAAMPAVIAEQERAANREAFRRRLVRQRDCSVFVFKGRGGQSTINWRRYAVSKAGRFGEYVGVGNFAALEAAAAKWREFVTSMKELRDFCFANMTKGDDGCYRGVGICVYIHGEQVNVYGGDVINGSATQALEAVKAKVANG